MNDLDNSIPQLAQLLEERLRVVSILAESLEDSRVALGNNDAEAIARGAAHQAELCRQWSRLEERLRAEAARRSHSADADSSEAEQSAELQAEWQALHGRIRYLMRVHASLLRHLERSLAVVGRIAASCAVTYTPAAVPPPADPRLRVGG